MFDPAAGAIACYPECSLNPAGEFPDTPWGREAARRYFKSYEEIGLGMLIGEGVGNLLGRLGIRLFAKALPMLTKGPGGKMLGEAVGYLRGLPGTERAAAFEKFAEQITKATNGQWSAKAFNATNARVFAGEGGEALVFDSAGNMFRGHLSDRAAFVFREGGQIEVIFSALRGL